MITPIFLPMNGGGGSPSPKSVFIIFLVIWITIMIAGCIGNTIGLIMDGDTLSVHAFFYETWKHGTNLRMGSFWMLMITGVLSLFLLGFGVYKVVTLFITDDDDDDN